MNFYLYVNIDVRVFVCVCMYAMHVGVKICTVRASYIPCCCFFHHRKPALHPHWAVPPPNAKLLPILVLVIVILLTILVVSVINYFPFASPLSQMLKHSITFLMHCSLTSRSINALSRHFFLSYRFCFSPYCSQSSSPPPVTTPAAKMAPVR